MRYYLPMAGTVSIKVYDQIGNLVKVLVNEHQPQGEHSVAFDAAKLASGVYFYRISVGNFSETKKMVLLR
ncbi:MAG: T9SS type A sorting domain-containing protein [Ignavibacteriales bacterium]|nr:T9SS type A sorting domain-containing protein [Ignavibacteriales bacterium]